jgi:hypothetical protein
VRASAAGERDGPAQHEEYWRLLPVGNTRRAPRVGRIRGRASCLRAACRIDPDSSACGKALISGYDEYAPFADYRPDPNSIFMTLDLRAPCASALK